MTRPVLVTGFEPFDGAAVNPSAEVALALHGRAIDGLPVVGVVLPCRFGVALDTLHAALDAQRPRLVLALGLAASRSAFSLERVAINIDDARIADNAGAQPIDQAVVPGAAAARFTTLPVKAMIAALRRAGHEAELSNSAGTFVCNHVFYGLQHALRQRRAVRSGFMHLPPLTHLPLPMMIGGVSIALAAAIANPSDLRASEGTLD